MVATLAGTACGDDATQDNGYLLPDGKIVFDARGGEDSPGLVGEDGAIPEEADALDLPDGPAGDPGSTPAQEVEEEKDVKEVVEPPCNPGEPCCVPGTQCYKKAWQIMGSKLSIIIDDQAYNPSWYLLGVLPPATMTVAIRLRSTGFNQLNLVDAFLEAGSNPFVTLQWVTPGMPGNMPLVLKQGEEVEAKLTYAPQGDPPPVPAIFTVWSSDPEGLTRSVVFKPKESGPDIELPYSATNWGCDNWCFGQEFLIENAGNKPLIIQSTQLEKPNPEWKVEGAPAPGTTLQPAGTPGYAPLKFVLDYCDANGSYVGDSNNFLIYSNDPDENPASIHMNVQLPELCANL